jgi:murein DD-endopeptidase MepM/ murein hydrolase activator NlpD
LRDREPIRTYRPSDFSLWLAHLVAIPLLVISLSGCKEEIVPEPYVPSTAHEAYAYALQQAHLDDTALGKDWLAAERRAMDEPVEVATPFRETFFVDSAKAFAMGYRFRVARGQRMEARVELNENHSFQIFADLFRLSDDTETGPVHVASVAEDELRLEFEPRRDGEYLLRLQAELLRGGECSVIIRNAPSLEFPVQDRDTGAILSGFGVPREAGRRQHHGVDIFAPRHTPVVATSRAFVRRVTDWKLGGRVVWLHDRERNLHLYYAHLETQEVEEDTWVELGETIGTVGNSGNARTTAPHLHFGIYVRGEGPLDPHPFIHRPEQTPKKVSVELDMLGSWARTIVKEISLRPVPDLRAPAIKELDLHTPLLVWAGTGSLFRVSLPDGLSGYVAARGVEAIDRPLKREPIAAEQRIFDQPSEIASVKERIEPGEELLVLGRYGDYLYVETPTGGTGWLSPD